MTLDEAPTGSGCVVRHSHGRPALVRRLAELGIRSGERVRVLHRTAGGGRVVAVSDTRIALSRAVLRGVEIDLDPAGSA